MVLIKNHEIRPLRNPSFCVHANPLFGNLRSACVFKSVNAYTSFISYRIHSSNLFSRKDKPEITKSMFCSNEAEIPNASLSLMPKEECGQNFSSCEIAFNADHFKKAKT